MRIAVMGCTALLFGALSGSALAQSLDDQIQNEEQPGSAIGAPLLFGNASEPSLQFPPAPERAAPPAMTTIDVQRPPLPPAEANPGIPDSEQAGTALDVPDDPDSPPDAGAASDLSGPGDEDPFSND